MSLKFALARPIAELLSKSYHFTKLARLVVSVYDNDANADMYKNGEFKLLNLISSLSVREESSENCVFVDVGANVGDWSAALIECGYKGRLVAIDPLPRNLEIVRTRLTALDYNNFDLCEYAVSDKSEKAKFFSNKDQSNSGTDSLFDMKKIGYTDEVDCIDVQTTTLDELISKMDISKINFLKIDIEGNELSALRGAQSLLSSGSINFIQIEFGHAARAAGVYLHDIVNFINEYDYNIFVIKPAGLLPLDFSPFTENRYSYINFLMVKNSIQDELKDLILKR